MAGRRKARTALVGITGGRLPAPPVGDLNIVAWFQDVVADMELRLVRAKYPPESWRHIQVRVAVDLDGRLSDALWLPRFSFFAKLIRERDPELAEKTTRTALWAAAVAAVSHRTLQAYHPTEAFILGRLWEWCFQEHSIDTLRRRLHGKLVSDGHEEEHPGTRDLHDQIRTFAAPLQGSLREKARAVRRAPTLKAEMLKVHGEMYSVSHLINRILKRSSR